MSQFGVISRYCQKKARLIAPRLNRPDRLLVIIVDVELMPTLVRPLGLYYRDWALQGEVQDSFGRQFDLLTFGRRLYAAAQTSPAAAPMAAPLPPPAIAPMMAPMPAPAPTFSAVFLPREEPWRLYWSVCML